MKETDKPLLLPLYVFRDWFVIQMFSVYQHLIYRHQRSYISQLNVNKRDKSAKVLTRRNTHARNNKTSKMTFTIESCRLNLKKKLKTLYWASLYCIYITTWLRPDLTKNVEMKFKYQVLPYRNSKISIDKSLLQQTIYVKTNRQIEHWVPLPIFMAQYGQT